MDDTSRYSFIFDECLRIKLPVFKLLWEEYSTDEQIRIINIWEKERAKIPGIIKQLENELMDMQKQSIDMDFTDYCKLHDEIVMLASNINNLNIWFRTEGYITLQQ